jgi:hypothetical protein
MKDTIIMKGSTDLYRLLKQKFSLQNSNERESKQNHCNLMKSYDSKKQKACLHSGVDKVVRFLKNQSSKVMKVVMIGDELW